MKFKNGSDDVFEARLLKMAILIGCVLPLLGMPVSGQKMGMGRGAGMPRYDTATEATFKGTVEEVKQVTGPMGGMAGTHLTLKTDKETLDVHLGPSTFLQQQKIEIAKGDQVEIIGSKVNLQTGEAVLAREVKKGDKVFTLRNKQGIPQWSMSRRRK